MFASPGPETTRSTSTRPYSRSTRWRASARRRCAPRSRRVRLPTRAARGGHRRSAAARCRGRCRRQSARRCRPDRPALRGARRSRRASRTGTDHASASRSFSRWARGIGSSLRSVSTSTTHGTFVSCARVPVIGPATPKLAASMSAGVVDGLAKKLQAQRAEIGEVERAVRADCSTASGARCAAREEAHEGFRSANVAGEQHR